MHRFSLAACMFWVTFFALPQVALSHSNEVLSTQQGAHGGMLRMSGPYHLELLVEEGKVRVWVTDHGDTPQSTAGARGQLMVMQGKERFMVELSPEGENVLRGGDSRLGALDGLRAVLTLSMSGKAPVQVRFAPAEQAAQSQGADVGH